MVAPTKREADAVRQQIEGLPEEERTILVHIVSALGFSQKKLGELLGKSEEEMSALISGEEPFTGELLVKLCIRLCFRPGIVQKRFNFDRDESPVKSTGWIGPHDLLTEGHRNTGKVFKAAATTMNTSFGFTQAQLNRIGNGSYPITIDALRAVVQRMRKGASKTRNFSMLEAIYENLPHGIKTLHDIQDEEAAADRDEAAKGGEDENMDQQVPHWSENERTFHANGRAWSLDSKSDMQIVARNIRDYISVKDLKLTEVMKAISKNRTFLNMVEREKASFEKVELEMIAAELDVAVAALFTNERVAGAPKTSRSRNGDILPFSPEDEDAQRHYRELVLAINVEPGEKVSLRAFIELQARAREGDETIDWVGEFLGKTHDGQQLMQQVTRCVEHAKGHESEMDRRLFIALLKRRLKLQENDE